MNMDRMWAIMEKKGIPQELDRAVQSEKQSLNWDGKAEHNSRCGPDTLWNTTRVSIVSSYLLNLYINDIIHYWKIHLPQYFMLDNCAVDTLLLADDQAIQSNLENGLQISVHSFSRVYKDFGLQISTPNTKMMTFHAADSIRTNIDVGGQCADITALMQISLCVLHYIQWYCKEAICVGPSREL